jgi:hypothetical protein
VSAIDSKSLRDGAAVLRELAAEAAAGAAVRVFDDLLSDMADRLEAGAVAMRKLEAAIVALERARGAFPDSRTAGDGAGYLYAWDECTGQEQEWVKREVAALEASIAALRE